MNPNQSDMRFNNNNKMGLHVFIMFPNAFVSNSDGGGGYEARKTDTVNNPYIIVLNIPAINVYTNLGRENTIFAGFTMFTANYFLIYRHLRICTQSVYTDIYILCTFIYAARNRKMTPSLVVRYYYLLSSVARVRVMLQRKDNKWRYRFPSAGQGL